MTTYCRILLDGYPILTEADGDRLVARDGRGVSAAEATYLPPSEPKKIICVHLNYASRVKEYITKLPVAPTYFHKPTAALNTHKGDVVRPEHCKWLNYEGEIGIVIGRHCRNITLEPGDMLLSGTPANSRPVKPGDLVEVEGLGRPVQPDRSGAGGDPRRFRRPADRIRGGSVDRPWRRLGTSRQTDRRRPERGVLQIQTRRRRVTRADG